MKKVPKKQPKKQTIILTEDSGAGLLFYDLLNKYIFNDTLLVTNTSLRVPNKPAGAGRFKQAVRILIQQGYIKKGVRVFLAADQIIGSTEKTKLEIKALKDNLHACETMITDAGAYYKESPFICWEELPLSFRHLLQFIPTAPQFYSDSMKKFAQHMNLFQAVYTDDEKLSQYFSNLDASILEKYFGATPTHSVNIEHRLANLLKELTETKTANEPNTFLLDKRVIGECWHQDCDKIKQRYINIRGTLCKHCQVASCNVHRAMSVGQVRFAHVVENSKIWYLCRIIRANSNWQ